MIRIDSLEDPRVEVFRDVRDRDLKGRQRLFMAESGMVLRRLLRTPERVHAVLLTPERFEDLVDDLQAFDGDVFVAETPLMSAITGFHIHRGVLAAGIRPRRWALASETALGHVATPGPRRLLVAEGITNVDNLGALFRVGAAFGVDGILLDPRCCDPLYRKAIRVSMGHVFSVPYAVADTWPQELRRLRDAWHLQVVAAALTPASRALSELAPSERLAIVVGSEATGLPAETLAECDEIAQIPMSEGVDSLNVAVAAAVFLHTLRPSPVAGPNSERKRTNFPHDRPGEGVPPSQ